MNDKLLKAIGRLTVDFAYFDETVSHFCETYDPKGRASARKKIEKTTTGLKVALLKKHIEKLAGDLTLTADPLVDRVLDILARACQLIKKRNQIVHGSIELIPEVDLTLLHYKKISFELNADYVISVVDELSQINAEITNQGIDLWHKLRKLKK